MTPDQEAQFSEMVKLCTRLKEEGKIKSGFTLFITEDGRISVKTTPPPNLNGKSVDLEEILKQCLSYIQDIRHHLGNWFDLDAKSWNATDIGIMLQKIEKLVRESVYSMERGEAYNSMLTVFLISSMHDLLLTVTTNWFRRCWTWLKLSVLNNEARTFEVKFQKTAHVQMMNHLANLVIVIDEQRSLFPGNASRDETIVTLLNPALLNYLKSVDVSMPVLRRA